MPSSHFLAAALLLASSAAGAASIHKRDLSLKVELDKPPEFTFYPYAINMTIGKPPQLQRLALTFGNKHTVVLDSESLCAGRDSMDANLQRYGPCQSGSYNASASRSNEDYFDDTFELEFAGEQVAGERIVETIGLGGVEMKNAQLSLAKYTRLVSGFMGMTPNDNWGSEPPGILDYLEPYGHSSANAFSLWASGVNESAVGTMLFGAVDRSKYHGRLQRVQASAFRERYNDLPGWSVNVSSILASINLMEPLTNETSTVGARPNFYATISPTTSLTNLPPMVAEPIWRLVNATLAEDAVWRTVRCDATIPGNISIEVGGEGGYRINATLQDLIVPQDMWSRQQVESGEPELWCMFGIQSDADRTSVFNHESSEPWVIGNNLLKDTYMVFDAANAEVSMAPLRDDRNASQSDLVYFEEVDARSPDSDFVGYKECFNMGCNDDYYDEDDNYYSDSGSGGLSRNGRIILGSVLGTASLIALGVATWFVLRCRRRRKDKAAAEAAEQAEKDALTREFDDNKFIIFGAPTLPPKTKDQMSLPRKPVPTHSREEEIELVDERWRNGPEPKSIVEFTPATTVSPMSSTPRDSESRSVRDAIGHQR